MKCQTAYVWILASKATTSLPDEVQRHLRHCRRCQLCQKRLSRLDGELKQLSPPPESQEGKVRLFQKLAQLPQQRPLSPRSQDAPRGGKKGPRILAYTTAAAILIGIGLGWLLSPGGNSSALKRPVASAPAPTAPAARPRALDIVARAVGHDLSLAETFSPLIQVRTLGELAADLRHEALRLAQQGPLEDLPLVATLYQRVLRQGVVRRARALPAGQQPAVLVPLAKQLQESATEVTRVAEESLPAVGDYLRAMSLAANETARVLREDPKAVPFAAWPGDSGGPRPLLETVVVEGLRLAEEEDPLRRADTCSALAEQLVQTILLTSAMGESKQAMTLGKCLGDMVDRGVTDNLNRVEVNEADKDRLAELQRVHGRMAAASSVLQTNLQRAPPQARAGLQRAMEASQRGLERAAQAGKGKGKPKTNHKPGHPPKGRPMLPPGLEKKRDKDRREQRNEEKQQEQG